jgi:hypothetical protein
MAKKEAEKYSARMSGRIKGSKEVVTIVMQQLRELEGVRMRKKFIDS